MEYKFPLELARDFQIEEKELPLSIIHVTFDYGEMK